MQSNVGGPIYVQSALTAHECQMLSENADSTPANGKAIDTKFLRSWWMAFGDNPSEFLAEVIAVYFEEAAVMLPSLIAAASIGDALALNYKAHTLKSSSATLGAFELSQLCYALELMTCTGNTAGSQEIVSKICTEYERVKAALPRELQQFQAEFSHGVASPSPD